MICCWQTLKHIILIIHQCFLMLCLNCFQNEFIKKERKKYSLQILSYKQNNSRVSFSGQLKSNQNWMWMFRNTQILRHEWIYQFELNLGLDCRLKWFRIEFRFELNWIEWMNIWIEWWIDHYLRWGHTLLP